MNGTVHIDIGQSVKSDTDVWYRKLQSLGSGGNAITFLAVATSGMNRGVPFAIKVFRNLSKPQRRENFNHEVAFLKDCDHPSIMRVFDAGVFMDNFPFLVAEYLPDTLYQIIRAGRTSLVMKVSFALQLLSALSYLEQRSPSVVHRDIKPKNIFVKGRSCVLGDFGLLKFVTTDSTEDREVLRESVDVGMPYNYRTPDLVAYLNNEADVTPKSDVFQLGLVLAELFTGRNPHVSKNNFSEPLELEQLRQFPGSFSRSIMDLITGMLEPNPNHRKSAIDFMIHWDGIFQAAAKQANALEGRALW